MKDFDDVASYVQALAVHHGVHVKRTHLDVLADDISRLSDADYTLDNTAEMLIALYRNGVISNEKAL